MKKHKIIDQFYNEENEPYIEKSDEFYNRLKQDLKIMDVLDDVHFKDGIDTNIFKIIQKAELLQTKKKLHREFLQFMACSLLIVGTLARLLLLGGPMVFLYLESACSVVLPFLIIPLALIRRSKEVQK